jgi:nickel/cobalt transporter (NiCoT) family protein
VRATAWRALDREQRRSLLGMAGVVGGLHVVGFGTLVALVAPGDNETGALSLGVGLTAYTLGMRHAFDADHISAIDNTTRKLIAEGKRPLSVGFWFSLGHSSIVFVLALALSIGIRSFADPAADRGSTLHDATGWIGTFVSGTFLYAIAALNVAVLLGIVGVLRALRRGEYDERALEEQLESRGLMNRFLGGITRAISRPSQMFPVGALFGIGFDTATEVALLVLAGGAASAGLPWYAVLTLPLLFAAGMSLLDTLDGSFMHFAYGWALSRPVRKVFYNLTVTALSILVAFAIGTVELGGLLASKLSLSGSFWDWLEGIDLNLLGFVIVGLFVVAWVVALAVWRFGRIEERWSAELAGARDP